VVGESYIMKKLITFTKYNCNDGVRVYEMSRACSINEEKINAYRSLRKSDGKRALGKPRTWVGG
jgi:hypothetical protein